jgi:putative ATP-dependent endonuclease of OLD family
MYLKRFGVKNFRSFDENGLELYFNKGVNALIGENNSGKSSVIDAIRIAFSTVTYNKDIFFYKSDFHVSNDGKMATYSQFDVYLEEVPCYLIEIWDPEGMGGEFHIRFERYLAHNGQEKIKNTCWGIGGEGNLLSTDTFEAIEMAFLGALRDSESEMKPSRNSKIAQLLKNMIPEESEREELVKIIQHANHEVLKKEKIQKTRDTINLNLSNLEQEILCQQIDIGFIEPRFDSIASSLRTWVKPKWNLINEENHCYSTAQQYFSDNLESKLVHNTEDGIYFDSAILNTDLNSYQDLKDELLLLSQYPFELYQNGLGYNNLLFMSTVLGDMSLNKQGVYHNLLLIEEPEAHLHPQLQELVHNFFKDINKEATSIQVIYTSHSPTLVAKIGLDNVNLLYDSNHRKWCLPLSKTNLDDDDKTYLEKYLDVTKSQMFFAKGILFVEGISEALLFPEMAKLIERPFDKYAVEVVNLDSVAFKPFVDLFSTDVASKFFTKIAIITDDDRCTTKGEKYISKDLDYDELNEEILKKLREDVPSKRCQELDELCKSANILMTKAIKTLEYALCCCDNNIVLMLSVLKDEFPQAGLALEARVNSYTLLEEKAACIWLFIRYRDSHKGAIAQRLCKLISEQVDKKKNGLPIDNEFEIPEYIREAILSVTEK